VRLRPLALPEFVRPIGCAPVRLRSPAVALGRTLVPTLGAPVMPGLQGGVAGDLDDQSWVDLEECTFCG
jgi:hypothetical protein